MQPEKGLATHQIEGKKEDKARITVVVTSNGDGSERVPLWIIGTSHNPHCFNHINHSLLGCHYRNNKTAQMTTDIMIEFLERFNRKTHCHNRRVALLLDNFSAREAAVRTLGGEKGLSNVRITWLPKNTTPHHQPNGQGFIQALKAHTRHRFLSWQIVEYDAHRDSLLQSLDTQTVLQQGEFLDLSAKMEFRTGCVPQFPYLPL